MRKHNKTILENNGMNTSQYLSLQINKSDLPEGSAVVIMVQDERTGELRPISSGNMQAVASFAQNSRFYGKRMADGHLFHPHIHRRFIAAQFKQLIKLYGSYGIKDGFARTRNWDYAIGVLCKEVRTLANLERKDRQAFGERSRFFTLDDCRQVLADYTEAVCRYVDDRSVTKDRDGGIYLLNGGWVKAENIRPFKHRFNKLALDAKNCRNYVQLNALLDGFQWQELPRDHILPFSFVTPFLESGAYFTLKHHMMFEGLRLQKASQYDSLQKLRDYSGSFLSWYPSLMQ